MVGMDNFSFHTLVLLHNSFQFLPLLMQHMDLVIDREHMSQALNANYIDVCIILIDSPPTMLQHLESSKALYNVERKLRVLSNENGLSILLVDGSDHKNITDLMEKDLRNNIKSYILVGDGIEDVSWISEDSSITNRAGISDLFETIRKQDRRLTTPISLCLRYGGPGRMKADLEKKGSCNVKVWTHSSAPGNCTTLFSIRSRIKE